MSSLRQSPLSKLKRLKHGPLARSNQASLPYQPRQECTGSHETSEHCPCTPPCSRISPSADNLKHPLSKGVPAGPIARPPAVPPPHTLPRDSIPVPRHRRAPPTARPPAVRDSNVRCSCRIDRGIRVALRRHVCGHKHGVACRRGRRALSGTCILGQRPRWRRGRRCGGPHGGPLRRRRQRRRRGRGLYSRRRCWRR